MSASPTEPLVPPAAHDGTNAQWAGDELRSTLRFLALPGALVVALTLFGVGLPGWALYGIGATVGIALLLHTLKDPEWLMAIAIIYLPLNMMFVVPIGPGLNGTNLLLLLLLFSSFRHGRVARTEDRTERIPATALVRNYAVVTSFSVLTAIMTLGLDFILDRALAVKGWIDQFIVFFTLVRLIRDGNMARRLVVYMMLGSLVVLALGFQEWLEKLGASSIEKSRLLGPQMQPNDFGAFLAYAATPYLALLLVNIRNARMWLVAVPYLGLTTRILLGTFSRGAYLGMGLASIVATYVRGKMFLLGVAVLGAVLVIAVPEVVPQSLRARMGQTESSGGEHLDKSSQTRLILWNAALKMTLERPVFGWGFKSFPLFKEDFTDTQVEESDNHNMYLYLSSQMGIPAVVLFVLILWRMYSLGVRVYRSAREPFTRLIGMTAASLAGAASLVNMFGSRMVDICVSIYFWVTLAVIARLSMEVQARRVATESVS